MLINWTPEEISAAATVVLAIVTFVLAFGTVFLWLATKKLVVSAETTAERQLRAYVFIKTVNLELVMGKPPIAHIKLRKFGKTPAYEMTEWAKMGFDQYPLVNGEPPRDNREGLPQLPLAPGGSLIMRPKHKEVLNSDHIAGMKKGTFAFDVIG
jgi:hypothetical protein